MALTAAQLRAPLGFARPEHVLPDAERPGLLRARTLPMDTAADEAYDYRLCVLNDCTHAESAQPRLESAGCETVDLSSIAALQRAIESLRVEDRVTESSAQAIRDSLTGAYLELNDGKRLRIEHVADEGLIHRRAGPNGLDVNPGGVEGANGHGGAAAVHGDQDVFGTPLAQMMNGGAPELFRHRSPDACNETSPLFLLNLWIPIQQITRPLVLMDRRTLDQAKHQLRYGLPVTRFLDRDEASSVNDIWKFLPHPDQVWFYRSTMGPGEGWLFDTLGAPHGACVLPGEDAIESLFRLLGDALDAHTAADARALSGIARAEPPSLSDSTPAPVRAAWQRMTALLREANAPGDAWRVRVIDARDAVVRKSVEMRLVATLIQSD